MAELRQKLRGTTAQLDAYVGAQGLLVVDLTRLDLRVYDGLAAGGEIIPNLQYIDNNYLSLSAGGEINGEVTVTESVTVANRLKIKDNAADNFTGLDFQNNVGITGARIQAASPGKLNFVLNEGAGLTFGGQLTIGNSVPLPESLVTREKADIRYLRKDQSGAVEGTLRVENQLAVRDASGNGISDLLFQTNNAQTRIWLRNDGNQYLRVLSFNGSSTVESARIDAPGTFMPSEKSVITREKGDVRYVKRADTALPSSILSAIIDHVYPVGTVLWTSNSANPGVYWPGTTWVPEFAGRAAHGVGGGRTNGAGWGVNTRSIFVANLPSHKHGPGTYNGVTNAAGKHAHGPGTLEGNTNGMSQNTSHQHRVFDQTGAGGSNSSGGFNNERFAAVTIFSNTGGIRDTDPANIDHTHYVQMSSGATAENVNHAHTVSLTGGESGATGNGTPFNVNQPSQARHAWRRTA